MLRLTRGKSYADKARAYHVLLDGQDIGEIRQGETREFPVSGRHSLQLKVDWCTSPSREFEAGEEPVSFYCKTNMGGLRVFLAFYYIFFGRHAWIRLERVAA
jgi:hypothetical protein